MTYDYHGSYDRVTGQNAPLYPGSADTSEAARQLNIVCVFFPKLIFDLCSTFP